MSTNTARIAKNTLALYFRQILIMLVSLYTVRVVLNTLGAEDYGIYSVVAGVVTMFGFLSNSMATASQRYFSFELGKGDLIRLRNTFSLTLLIYTMIAALVLLLAETAGLWFISNKIVIPQGRGDAVLWIYQTSIASFVFTIFTSPYMALIIIHDGNRGLVSEKIINDALDVYLKFGSAVTAIPCQEAVFETMDNITSYKEIPRENIVRIQSPQIFSLGRLLWAYEEALKRKITPLLSPCLLLHKLGMPVHFSKGSERNIKITTEEDFNIFRALLSASGMMGLKQYDRFSLAL